MGSNAVNQLARVVRINPANDDDGLNLGQHLGDRFLARASWVTNRVDEADVGSRIALTDPGKQ